MTALAAPIAHRPLPVPTTPSVPRLIGGGLVAAIGISILSIAIGGYVVGSAHLHVASQADEARRLVGTTPALVAVGLLHLLAALALARGRDLLRVGAAFASGLMALAATSYAAMLAAGVDPIGGRDPHPSAGALVLIVIAALAYGTAGVAAGSGPTEG
jgi:hypothetical protein